MVVLFWPPWFAWTENSSQLLTLNEWCLNRWSICFRNSSPDGSVWAELYNYLFVFPNCCVNRIPRKPCKLDLSRVERRGSDLTEERRHSSTGTRSGHFLSPVTMTVTAVAVLCLNGHRRLDNSLDDLSSSIVLFALLQNDCYRPLILCLHFCFTATLPPTAEKSVATVTAVLQLVVLRLGVRIG